MEGESISERVADLSEKLKRIASSFSQEPDDFNPHDALNVIIEVQDFLDNPKTKPTEREYLTQDYLEVYGYVLGYFAKKMADNERISDGSFAGEDFKQIISYGMGGAS